MGSNVCALARSTSRSLAGLGVSQGLTRVRRRLGPCFLPISLTFHVMALPAKKGDEIFHMRLPGHGLSLVLRKLLAGKFVASVPSDIFHGVLLAVTCSDV